LKRFSISFSISAESDLNEIVNYFEPINQKYAVELYLKLRNKIEDLYENPERGRVVPELEHRGINDYRELLEGNYRVIYSIKGQNVFIHTIIDSRRNLEEILIKRLMERFD
jgi:plasmid stabilization system protein ParE